jgi:threonine/homoserine/homoserine lactone efflux protein
VISATTLALYIPAVIVMVLTPGPAIFFTLNRSLAYGRRGGFATAAGLVSGTIILFTCAALGLTVILRASAGAYDLLKIAGAAYLVYLGIRAIAAAGDGRFVTAPDAESSLLHHYIRGLAAELLNPKAAMFYISVLPQFVNRAAGHVTVQMLLLGGVFAVFAAGSLTMVTLSSSRLKAALAGSPRVQVLSRWATGTVLIGFGVRLAFERR